MINRIESRLKDLTDHYHIFLQGKSNSRLKVLTIISAVFLPATLLAGIYGMNFERMPGVTAPYGFLATLGGMLFLLIGLLVWFGRQGWFNE